MAKAKKQKKQKRKTLSAKQLKYFGTKAQKAAAKRKRAGGKSKVKKSTASKKKKTTKKTSKKKSSSSVVQTLLTAAAGAAVGYGARTLQDKLGGGGLGDVVDQVKSFFGGDSSAAGQVAADIGNAFSGVSPADQAKAVSLLVSQGYGADSAKAAVKETVSLAGVVTPTSQAQAQAQAFASDFGRALGFQIPLSTPVESLQNSLAVNLAAAQQQEWGTLGIYNPF